MKNLSCDISIEITKDNKNIVKIIKDNKIVYIGSKYNMGREIDNFINNVNLKKNNDLFIVFGFATGEHLQSLRKKYKKNGILVLEPNKALKKYAESLQWIRNDDNIKIFDLDDHKIKKYINEFNVDNININIFANYSKVYSKECKIFFENLKAYCIELKSRKTTKLRFSDKWFKTLIDNLLYVIESRPCNLYKNIYKDKPAIIISAGPSLEKNINCLKNQEENFFIFTGARTFKGLIDRDIKPDMLAVLDPGDKLYKMVEGYIEKENIPLFFYEGTNSKVVKNHKGIKILSRYSHSYSKLMEEITETSLIEGEGGGSVAHYMTLHALYMGCNPIIFVGQDLAYDDKNKYSKLAQINNEVIEKIEKEDDIYVEGVTKELVRSDIYLNSFRIELEKIIKRFFNVKFINATEGGARINGTLEMSLKDAVDKYGNKFEKNIDVKYSVNIRKNILEKLQNINNECLELFELLKIILEKTDIFHDENNEILNLENKIDRHINNLEILQTLFYPVFYEVLSNKYGLIDISTGKINYILEEKKVIYRKIKDIVEYALPQINKVLKNITIYNGRSE